MDVRDNVLVTPELVELRDDVGVPLTGSTWLVKLLLLANVLFAEFDAVALGPAVG